MEQDPRHPLDARVDSPGAKGSPARRPPACIGRIVDADRSRARPTGAARRAAGMAARLPDRLAAGSLRRAPRLHEVHGADEPGVRRRAVLDRRAELAAAPPRAAGDGEDREPRRRFPSAVRSRFTIPRQPIAACWFARRRTSLVAYSQKCTHLSCAVIPQAEQNRLSAPATKASSICSRAARSPARRNRPLPRVHARGARRR